jgi:hypothetical protein
MKEHGDNEEVLRGPTDGSWGIRHSDQFKLLERGNSWPNEELFQPDEPTYVSHFERIQDVYGPLCRGAGLEQKEDGESCQVKELVQPPEIQFRLHTWIFS